MHVIPPNKASSDITYTRYTINLHITSDIIYTRYTIYIPREKEVGKYQGVLNGKIQFCIFQNWQWIKKTTRQSIKSILKGTFFWLAFAASFIVFHWIYCLSIKCRYVYVIIIIILYYYQNKKYKRKRKYRNFINIIIIYHVTKTNSHSCNEMGAKTCSSQQTQSYPIEESPFCFCFYLTTEKWQISCPLF